MKIREIDPLDEDLLRGKSIHEIIKQLTQRNRGVGVGTRIPLEDNAFLLHQETTPARSFVGARFLFKMR